jgi:hypothetical protein
MDIYHILWTFATFYGHLVYFLVIWYIIPILVSFSKKNLATLLSSGKSFRQSAAEKSFGSISSGIGSDSARSKIATQLHKW